jgi:hypothetical protein
MDRRRTVFCRPSKKRILKVGCPSAPASLNRPQGNATGVSFFRGEIGGKRLARLHQVVRKDDIGFLMNPENPVTDEDLDNVQAAAGTLGVTLRILPAHTADEIQSAFGKLAEQQVGAVLFNTDAFHFSRRRLQDSGNVLRAHLCSGIRPDELRLEQCGLLPAGGRVCGHDSQGCEAERSAHPEDRQILAQLRIGRGRHDLAIEELQDIVGNALRCRQALPSW